MPEKRLRLFAIKRIHAGADAGSRRQCQPVTACADAISLRSSSSRRFPRSTDDVSTSDALIGGGGRNDTLRAIDVRRGLLRRRRLGKSSLLRCGRFV